MYQYRVTKYDPEKRDRRGAYLEEDWTCQSQIGQTFGGVTLTAAEYERIETAYVEVAFAFIRESDGKSLQVIPLEIHNDHQEFDLHLCEGMVLAGQEIEQVCRLNLRGSLWCKLEDSGGRFIHFGYDYYMYIGVPIPCERAQALAHRLGLFVETFVSPYFETNTD